jgi:hypothetical protein
MPLRTLEQAHDIGRKECLDFVYLDNVEVSQTLTCLLLCAKMGIVS